MTDTEQFDIKMYFFTAKYACFTNLDLGQSFSYIIFIFEL